MDLPLIPPMLATPGVLPPARQDARWAYETKQDGQRVVVYLPGDGSVLLRARSGQDITGAYPELAPLATALGATSAVLDGEVLVLDEQGRADFQLLQSRMGLAHAPGRAAHRAARVPAHLVLFDALHLAGESLLRLPYTARRDRLTGLGLNGPSWSTPAALVGHGEQALRATREHGLEGLVCKRLDSVYEPGVRSRAWVKIRNMRGEDVVVGGWLPGKGRLTGLPGAVLVGQRAAGRLRYVGGVGTGWNAAERDELAALLRAAASDVCPFDPVPPVPGARWVVPRLVGEVRYSARTREGMLRQPSWLRLRPDLAPEDSAADLPDDPV
ncbi:MULTISPECIES: ATP-dependent DNA ligase [Streptomyces]|uniref:ATP-dependent DNA ligase n=1 Tax=Streptomyces TaxID=1883 RepID=UPI0003A20120|nr:MULTISPECIES: ATP-dependent DNA ligase [Streptomyces]AOW85499.1 ATP-dependent DNA ligase [Streptomyces olivaceus]MBZ6113713.1 ATP-dependent DNA ligase [Streptomyces olivaceus]MBZ6127372.1 ATP-dependent DNA ligase [Streptomyces olivaceus]MBZ6148341.1 ATP-dependent DNA ligase [Streptomyces olivaceus]MBZ6162258.1 ATP-dependent DNA ligase [Streptomyces olivaceus]